MKLVTLALVLAYMSKKGYSLECYTCNNCQRGFMREDDAVQKCEVNFLDTAQCFKEVEDDGDINRGCSHDLLCTSKSATGFECTETRTKDCYICCPDDKCNSASMTTFSMVTVFGTIIMMLFVHLK